MFVRALFLFLLLSLSPAYAEQPADAGDADQQTPQIESETPGAPPRTAGSTETRTDDAGPRPFDESANAMQDVDAALLSARSAGKMPLLIFGGNWRHDSRGLAPKFEIEPLKSQIETRFETVWIDVGHRDCNLEIAKRFGVERIVGTPTVIILSPEGEVLNADSAHDWRTADSKPFDETLAYFSSFAPRR